MSAAGPVATGEPAERGALALPAQFKWPASGGENMKLYLLVLAVGMVFYRRPARPMRRRHTARAGRMNATLASTKRGRSVLLGPRRGPTPIPRQSQGIAITTATTMPPGSGIGVGASEIDVISLAHVGVTTRKCASCTLSVVVSGNPGFDGHTRDYPGGSGHHDLCDARHLLPARHGALEALASAAQPKEPTHVGANATPTCALPSNARGKP
jgi:hypothetical protein